MRIKLTMAYDGSAYSGFQRQRSAPKETVQGVLEETIENVFGEKIVLHGAGRTDAGVHALAQVAHYDTTRNIPRNKIQYALNRNLPKTLVITDVAYVDETFHARKCAVGKCYRYDMYWGKTPPAIGSMYFTHVPRFVDEEKFRKALHIVEGKHDFRGFCGRGSSVKNFTRTVYHISVERDGPWCRVYFYGDGFLRKMVRNLVGAALAIAVGDWPLASMQEALLTGSRSAVGPTAPAEGLFLEQVYYDQEIFMEAIKKNRRSLW